MDRNGLTARDRPTPEHEVLDLFTPVRRVDTTDARGRRGERDHVPDERILMDVTSQPLFCERVASDLLA